MGGSVLLVGAALVVGLGLLLLAGLVSWGRPVRWVLAVVGVLVIVSPVLLVGGFLASQPEPLEDDESLAIGVREDDGVALIWLGPDCDAVTELRTVLKLSGSPDSSTLELRAPEPGVAVESYGLAPTDHPEGMEAATPLPEELDLADHHSLTVVEERAAGVVLEPVVAESADRPGEYWFDEPQGWLPLEEAEQMMAAGELTSVCSAEPAS